MESNTINTLIFVMPIPYFYVFVTLSYMMALVILKSRYLILVLPDVVVCLGLGCCLHLYEKITPLSNTFMSLILTKLTGPIFCCHFNLLTGWPLLNKFHHLLIDYFIDTLYHKCMYYVPTKNPRKNKISKFHNHRKSKTLMRKRTKWVPQHLVLN